MAYHHVWLAVYLAAYLLVLQDPAWSTRELLLSWSHSGAESGVWMGEDYSGRKVCWNVIAGDTMWPNDLLGNAMSDGWLCFIGILLVFYL